MKIVFNSLTLKMLEKLPAIEQKKVLRKLKSLLENPLSGKLFKGQLATYRSVRAWPYRIIYSLDVKAGEIIVQHVAHRQGVYK